MPNFTLFQFGPIQFQVYPLNVSDMDHTTASDWARKEIAGAAIHREWVGEGDEEIHLKGRVFPQFFAKAGIQRGQNGYQASGLSHLDVLDSTRRLGQAHQLIRGGAAGGYVFGWFVIERLSRGHSLMGPEGVGQQIMFDATFQRVPVPDPAGYFTTLWGMQ